MRALPAFFAALLGLLLMPVCAPVLQAASPDAFDRLAGLAGRWVADDGSFEVDYRLVSRGSVLMERYGVDRAGETASAYHRDGDGLLMTHYCAQGNQPRLALVPGDAPDTFVFAFRDATGLPDPRRSHLVEQTLELHGDRLRRTETYLADGQRETTQRDFVRKADAPR